MRAARHGLLLLLLLAGCALPAASQYQGLSPLALERSFAPFRGTRVGGRSLTDLVARRVGLLITGIDFGDPRRTEGEVEVGTGTAVVVARDGYLLSAAHNVAARSLPYALFPDRVRLPGTWVTLAPANDPGLGLRVRLRGRGSPPGPVQVELNGRLFLAYPVRRVWCGWAEGDDDGPRQLDLSLLHVAAVLPEAFSWGPALDDELVVAGGFIDPTPQAQGAAVCRADLRFSAGEGESLEEGEAPTHVYRHHAPLRVGFSGGPLVDLQGRLLGVNAYAVHSLDGTIDYHAALRPDLSWLRKQIEADRAR